MIEGGYYIKARKIQDSVIAHASPHIREVWDWLLKEANYKEHKTQGKVLKRGQVLTSYEKIREGLYWQIGYRKTTYTKWQIEAAMKFLVVQQMITTMKTTRGLIVTICNYDTYQNPENYDNHNGHHNVTTIEPHDKVRKKRKKENPPISPQGDSDEDLSPEELFLKCVPDNLNTPKFRTIWFEEWIPFRRENRYRNPGYKTQGLKAALTKLNRDSGGSITVAIAIIRQSIELGYQGLFPLKDRKTFKPKHGTKGKGKYDKDPETIEYEIT